MDVPGDHGDSVRGGALPASLMGRAALAAADRESTGPTMMFAIQPVMVEAAVWWTRKNMTRNPGARNEQRQAGNRMCPVLGQDMLNRMTIAIATLGVVIIRRAEGRVGIQGLGHPVKTAVAPAGACANPASSLQCTLRPIGRGDLT